MVPTEGRAPPAPAYQAAAPEPEAARAAGGDAPDAVGTDFRALAEPARALRLWLHLTVFRRLLRQMELVDERLARHHAALGHTGLERLRALAPFEPGLAALLPFLEPFPNQEYAARRIRELGADGGMSAYRWCGGGAGWSADLPTDAEIVLHAFSAYMDSQLGANWSARHVKWSRDDASAGPSLQRYRTRPPHFVVALGRGRALAPAAGRHNLLHSLLLLLLALAADGRLTRPQLGPAGLNLLWVLGN